MIDLTAVPASLFLPVLEGELRRLAVPHKVYRHFLAAARLRLAADSAWFWRGLTGGGEDEEGETFWEGAAPAVELALGREFAAGRRPTVPRHVLLAPVRIHRRLAGVVGVERRCGDFELGDGRVVNRLARLLGEDLTRREDERLVRVLERIKEKVAAELRPIDLEYQILDGLHELVHYDHSASFLTFDAAAGTFRVEAEKIVWAKAKSPYIGCEIPAAPDLLATLAAVGGHRVLTGDRESVAAATLRPLLDYHGGRRVPATTSVLVAPLRFDGELLGVLKLAAWQSPAFDGHDAAVVERFLPAATVSIRNARVHRGLQDRALEAETRAGLAVLARAVAHDVNNALGAILPVAQQLAGDAAANRLDPETVRRDVEVIVENTQLCRRIFSNILRLGTEPATGGALDVNRTLGELEPILVAQTRPRSIELTFELAPDLPPVTIARAHFERIAWNLVTNAAEALPGPGGRIAVATRAAAAGVQFSVTDNGAGIPEELVGRVAEPFFTTKAGGTGLGLSICRSLAWQSGGRFDFASIPGTGTRVEVFLPAVAKVAP